MHLAQIGDVFPDPMPGEESTLEIRPFFEAEDFRADYTPEARAKADSLRAEMERQQKKQERA